MAAQEVLAVGAADRLVHRLAADLERLARAVAQQLLEAPVAAQDGAVPDEADADERVLEHRVLLAHHALQLVIGAPALGDVLEQPDVAARGLARLHRAAGDPAPEAGAVLPAHPLLPGVHLAFVDRGVSLQHRLVFGVGEVHVARGRADRRAGRVAEHFLEAPVAAHGAPLAGELDAHHDVVEQRLLLGEHALQLLLAAALLGDVLYDPHRALVRVLRIDRAAVGAVPEGAAVTALAQLDPARGLAARERLVDHAALGVLGEVGIEHRGGLAVELARAVAIHLLVAPVAAHDAPVLDEHDADRGGAENRLLLAQQARHFVGVAALLGDVLDDPDRALLRVLAVERLGDQAREEGGAVLAAHFPFDVELPAGREQRHRDVAERVVAVAAGVHCLSGLADQLVGRIAEHFGEALVAQEEAPVAREGDADRDVGEQRLVFELGVARAAGVARRRRFEDGVNAAARGRFVHFRVIRRPRGGRGS